MLLIIAFNLFLFSNSLIKLHFKKKYSPNDINNKFDYYQYLKNNELITEILIGTPFQTIPVTLRYEYESFFLTNPSSQGLFNSNKSQSFISNFSLIHFPSEIEKGYIANDTIKINFHNGNKNIEKISFLYITEPNASISNYGNIGLHYKDYSQYKNLNFIIQFKKRELIENYGYTYRFLSETEGEVLIGEYLHEYNKSYYDGIDFYSMKINPMTFGHSFKNFSFGNYSSDGKDSIFFNINNTFGGIIGNRLFLSLVRNYFVEKKCKFVNNYTYEYFYCDIDLDVTDFPDLKFYHKDTNFTFILNYQDLFHNINGKKYFRIIFEPENFGNWYFGQPFLSKYPITIDQDKKLIGFYKKLKERKSLFRNSVFYIILLLIIIGVLLYIIYKYVFKKKRKIRANEIEEEIDYTPINSMK